jgi:hypothetical protein
MMVWISYVPRQRRWTAHRQGLPELAAPSLPALRAALREEVGGGEEIRLVLSKVARAEIFKQRGTPVAVGWH